jgi:TrmH family RNA methyltransferase
MKGAPESRNVGKLIRDLKRRKARERRGIIVAEGRRLVDDALASGARVLGVVVADDVAARGSALTVRRAGELGVPVETVPREQFDTMADTDTPGGVLAAVEWEPRALEDLPPPPPRGVALVLDAVQDPGNAGTMLRTAHALGAWCAVALDGTADLRNPKVVRGAMGAHFRLPMAEAAFPDFAAWARRHGVAPCLAVQDGEPLSDLSLAGPRVALVVGSEGHGVREAWREHESRRVTIPMRQGAESLNAAVAAGILLYELLRAR